jgi:hypothetical protein
LDLQLNSDDAIDRFQSGIANENLTFELLIKCLTQLISDLELRSIYGIQDQIRKIVRFIEYNLNRELTEEEIVEIKLRFFY